MIKVIKVNLKLKFHSHTMKDYYPHKIILKFKVNIISLKIKKDIGFIIYYTNYPISILLYSNFSFTIFFMITFIDLFM